MFEIVWFVGGRRELKFSKVGYNVVGWRCAFVRLLFRRGPGRKKYFQNREAAVQFQNFGTGSIHAMPQGMWSHR
jgi:hypothetical protein